MNAYICDNCGYDAYRAKFRGTVDFSVLVFCPGCSHELRRVDDPLAALEPGRGGTFADFVAAQEKAA